MLPSLYRPTTITANTGTCIDNVLTNNDNSILTIDCTLCISQHWTKGNESGNGS